MIVTASIYGNVGPGVIGPAFVLDGRLVKTGELGWEVEDAQGMFRVKPGDIVCEIEDFDGALWAYLQSLRTLTAFRKPWLVVRAYGEQVFLGGISPDRCRRVAHERLVEVWAADWSTQLGEKVLLGEMWTRTPPKVLTSTGSEITYTGYALASVFGIIGRNQARFAGPVALFVGDRITSAQRPGKAYRITAVEQDAAETVVTLGGWDWLEAENLPGISALFTRDATSAETLGFWELAFPTTADTENPVYSLSFTQTVSGIVPGDRIKLIDPVNSASYEIVDVDEQWNTLYTREAVGDHLAGARFYWDDDSAATLVHQDARTLITNACAGICLPNFDDFRPADMPSPVVSWLPLQPLNGEALTGPVRVEATATGLRVVVAGGVLKGTPETGWTIDDGTGWTADWANQQVEPPTQFMPDESVELLMEFPGAFVPGTWLLNQGEAMVLHDYTTMKRHLVNGPTGVWREWTWTGAAWTGPVDRTWPGGVLKPRQLAGWPGTPGELVAVMENGTLAMLNTGASCTLTADQKRAVLCRTPWGVYLVGGKGYGRIYWRPSQPAGSQLVVDWQQIVLEGDGQLHAGTFAAIDRDTVFVLATMTAPDPQDKTRVATMTMALQLKAWPTSLDPAYDAIVLSEILIDAAPKRFSVVRDPTRPSRVIGCCGGALFQVSPELPTTIHRIQAEGMTALALVEAVCSAHNCIAAPGPDGVLYVISRMATGSAVQLDVDVVQDSQTLSRQWFGNIMVSGEDDESSYEVLGVEGGSSLTISKHPCTLTNSARKAMAMSLVQWFGVPRESYELTLFHAEASSPAPWQALPRWALVKCGDLPEARAARLRMDVVEGDATLTLIEAEGGAYGYGAF